MKRVALILFFIMLSSTFLSAICYADDVNEESGALESVKLGDTPVIKINTPQVDAGAAIVMDMTTGRVLYEKNAYTRRAMASTTKIMTAIIAIENGNMEDTVTVSKNAASVWGSNIKLYEGEKLKLKELMYGMMLESGNDAAIAVAEHIGGSLENFLEMMNRKAIEIGAENTHFKSPHGLDAPEHYSTAYDMALITQYALKLPLFCKIVSTKESTIPGRYLQNTNEMLFGYPGADGVKTGYTGQAGRCLVTSATRNNWKIISVVLGCVSRTNRAQNTKKVLDYAFTNFENKTLVTKEQFIKTIPVIRGISQAVNIKSLDVIKLPLRLDEQESLEMKVELPDSLEAPVIAGNHIGYAIFTANGKEIARASLVTDNAVRRKKMLDYLWDVFKSWGNIIRPV